MQREIAKALKTKIKRNWHVVPNIVDFESFPFVERKNFQCSSWIYVGALFNSKGVVELLRVFDLYKKQIEPRTTLTLVGEGPLETWIGKFSMSRGISDSVNIVQSQTQANVHKYLAQADLMVHLSPYETFGLISLEAIASGLPVISLKNGGAQETWGNLQGSCGRILNLDSTEEEIVEAIHEFSLNTSLDVHFESGPKSVLRNHSQLPEYIRNQPKFAFAANLQGYLIKDKDKIREKIYYDFKDIPMLKKDKLLNLQNDQSKYDIFFRTYSYGLWYNSLFKQT